MGERGGKSWTFQKLSQRLPQKKAEIYQKNVGFFQQNAGDFFTSLGEIGLKASRQGKGPCRSRERG